MSTAMEAPSGPDGDATTAPTPATASSWSSSLVHLAILVPLALGLFFFQLGQTDWADDSESVGGQIMQEMVSGHGWILPLRNDRHIPVKPPLFYWLGALIAHARHSGVDLFDARVPSAILATLGVVLVYFYARRAAGAPVALWSALILVTTPQFVIESHNSRVDMALCVFLTAALLCAHRVWEGEAGRRTALLAGLCVGLAALSKGPLAFGLAVLVFVPLAVFAPPAAGWTALVTPATLLAAIGLPALWYGAATVEQGLVFLRLHLYTENVGRLLGDQGHWPLWWYVEPLFTGGLPWAVLLPAAALMESALPRRTRRFLWVWVISMLVFFSLSPGKRRAYLLLLQPALAMLLGGWLVPQLARLRQAHRNAAVPRLVHVVVAALVVAGTLSVLALRMGVAGFGAAEGAWSHWWRVYLTDYTTLVLILVLGIGIGVEALARWLVQRRIEWAGYAFVGILALALGIGISASGIVRGIGASFQPFAERLSNRVDAAEPLSFFDTDDETAVALLFHLRRHIPVVLAPNADHPCEPPRAGLYLVAERIWENRPCFQDAQWHVIERGGPPVQSQRWRRLVLARYEAAAPATVQ